VEHNSVLKYEVCVLGDLKIMLRSM